MGIPTKHTKSPQGIKKLVYNGISEEVDGVMTIHVAPSYTTEPPISRQVEDLVIEQAATPIERDLIQQTIREFNQRD